MGLSLPFQLRSSIPSALSSNLYKFKYTFIAYPYLFSKTSFTTLWLGICYNFISPSKSSHRLRNIQKPSTMSIERKKDVRGEWILTSRLGRTTRCEKQ